MHATIASPPPFPHVLRIEPASQCNLACSHCPTGTVKMERSVMGEVVFDKVLSEISTNRNFIKVVVLYHGGEPLLNKNLCSMASRIKSIKNDIYIKTVSNGMALTRTTALNIIKSGIDAIEFSLDGESPHENESLRVGSKTQLTLNNITDLINLKKSLSTKTPEVFIATTQFLCSKAINQTLGKPPTPLWLRDLFEGKISGFKPTYALRWPHMGNQDGFDYFQPDGLTDGDECDHLISTITIRSNGVVVPCCYDLTSKLVMGNILDQSILTIWNSEKYTALRDSVREKKYISICNTCAVVRPPVYLIPKHS